MTPDADSNLTGAPTSQTASPTIDPAVSAFRSRLSPAVALFGLILIALIGGCLYFLDPWGWRAKAPDQGIAYHWQEAQRANDEREFDDAKEHLKYVLEASPFS